MDCELWQPSTSLSNVNVVDSGPVRGDNLAMPQKSAEKLRAILHIAEQLNAEHDLSALLQLIAREAARLLDAELASLLLLDVERGELWSKVSLDSDETLRFDA